MDQPTADTARTFFETLRELNIGVAIAMLLLVGAAVVLIWDLAKRWLSRAANNDIRPRIERIEHRMDLHIAESTKTGTVLTSCVQQLEANGREQLKALHGISAQLVLLNASSPDSVLDVENARLMISYQWNWCSDVAIRATRSSIENNHFRGNEGNVIAKTQRAWAKAAKNARESLDRLNKFNYPYELLFSSAIWTVFEQVMQLAIPLYHSTSDQGLRDQLEAFEDSARGRFELMLDAYFRKVEDIDHGDLYRDDTSHTRSQIITADTILPTLDRLASELREYKIGSGARPAVQDYTTEVRHMQKKLQQDDIERREYQAHDHRPSTSGRSGAVES